jgi:hypothetical protein
MRLLLILLALTFTGAATWLHQGAKSSYSAYSGAQLDALEREFEALSAAGPLGDKDAFSLRLLRTERQRRVFLPVSIAGALLSFVLLARALLRRPAATPAPTDEEQRLAAAVGDPLVELEAAKVKAAKLLGVARDAPPAVVEAALEAQLRERDPSNLEGLAPALRTVAAEQREALVKARDLLLGRKA